MIEWQELIEEQALRLIRRFETYARQISDENERRIRRSTAPPTKLKVLRPPYWQIVGFDPYKVRANASRIAHSISMRVNAGLYEARNPLLYSVPKAGGGSRSVSVFQVADSALSGKLFETLSAKNRRLMSARAYAYRKDLCAHDALNFVATDLRAMRRTFVAEYDFSSFFENIRHEHIWRTLSDRGFSVSEVERAQIRTFLTGAPQEQASYSDKGGARRSRGLPQGLSLSLFLANVAAWDLDRELEKLGVSFARFADDTVVWSNSYDQVCRAADTIYSVADRMGAPINPSKSHGVRMLTCGNAEIVKASSVHFLSHEISHECVRIKLSALARFKARAVKLIYFHLLREPKRKAQNPGRITTIDRDYVALIWQLRRTIYGGLSEAKLRRFMQRGTPRQKFRGFMAFFPLVDDENQLKELDDWLFTRVRMAIRKRAIMLAACGLVLPGLDGLSASELRKLRHVSGSTGQAINLRFPSFRLMSRVLRDAVRRHGVSAIVGNSGFEYQRSRAV